jgi:hypothetical protein
MNINQLPNVQVTSLSAAPNLNVSATFEVTARLGRNTINRVASTSVSFFPASSTVDNVIQLAAATVDPQTQLPVVSEFEVPLLSPLKALSLAVSAPLECRITVNNVEMVLPVSKVLLLDAPITKLVFANNDVDTTPQVHFIYAL